MNFEKFLNDLKTVQTSGSSFVVVTFVGSQGSAPQEVGARMLVTDKGYFSGTVGGGKLEKAAIEKGLALLKATDSKAQLVEWNLQTDLGMSCGGKVNLFFEVHNLSSQWNIVLFGAGHVAQELSRVLLRLECRITCVDSRAEWLEKLPSDSKLNRVLQSPMEGYVSQLTQDQFIVIASMGHSTDLPILKALENCRHPFPYIGVIGSEVKGKKLKAELSGLAFHCPMGEPIGNNTPAEIAISISAQLIKYRDLTNERRLSL